MKKWSHGSPGVLAMCASALLLACGSETNDAGPSHCGPGTTLGDGGYCVPVDPHDAGTGGTDTGGAGGTGNAGASGAGGSGATGGTGTAGTGTGGSGAAATGGSSGDSGAGTGGTGGEPDAGADSADAEPDADPWGDCVDVSTCDDSIPCTVDTCSNGVCAHWPGPASSCPTGQYCDLVQGCIAGPACADDSQCQQLFASDPCKVNVKCAPATKTCTYDVLDGDNDGHPPVVCGGDDCRDDNANIHPGQEETCGIDDTNCDGNADVGAVCPSALEQCVNHDCVCKPEHTCPGIPYCIDLQTSAYACGACDHVCTGQGAKCVGGQCVCPLLCDDVCVEPDTDRSNCGACGNDCGYGEGVSCVGGQCVCRTGMLTCGGTCVDPEFDPHHCGGCNQPCAVGQVCQNGSCEAVPGGVTELVYVPRPDGTGMYGIDRTEVSRAQFAAWVAMQPPDHDQTPFCMANTVEVPDENSFCMTHYLVSHGWNWEQHPQVCIDWCDAELYCWTVGKRLCGAVDGGPEVHYPQAEMENQWYTACSAAGEYHYTYGDSYNVSSRQPCAQGVGAV